MVREGLTLRTARNRRGRCHKTVPIAPDGCVSVRVRRTVESVSRGIRTDLPDGFFHVTTRGVDSCLIFLDDADRVVFLRLLAKAVARQAWTCDAFCLMGTHYHLVLETKCSALSAGLHRLNGVYAQTFNRRYQRKGHLFGDRFASWVIDSEAHLRAACRYVLDNPVRAGCAREPTNGRGAEPAVQRERTFRPTRRGRLSVAWLPAS